MCLCVLCITLSQCLSLYCGLFFCFFCCCFFCTSGQWMFLFLYQIRSVYILEVLFAPHQVSVYFCNFAPHQVSIYIVFFAPYQINVYLCSVLCATSDAFVCSLHHIRSVCIFVVFFAPTYKLIDKSIHDYKKFETVKSCRSEITKNVSRLYHQKLESLCNLGRTKECSVLRNQLLPGLCDVWGLFQTLLKGEDWLVLCMVVSDTTSVNRLACIFPGCFRHYIEEKIGL